MMQRSLVELDTAGLWRMRTSGVMQVQYLADGLAMAWNTQPSGLLVDHRQTVFALTVEELLGATGPNGTAAAMRTPVAWVLRPDLLPLYAQLTASLLERGLIRRCFLSEQDALEWLGRQAR